MNIHDALSRYQWLPRTTSHNLVETIDRAVLAMQMLDIQTQTVIAMSRDRHSSHTVIRRFLEHAAATECFVSTYEVNYHGIKILFGTYGESNERYRGYDVRSTIVIEVDP